ncbi:MAG: DUF2877 domain-containing protein [Desulfovibrio sp.]|jgi:hypothetical protein|nr:DUF2877 domain-containing protein [Desulfovibrio sp.]
MMPHIGIGSLGCAALKPGRRGRRGHIVAVFDHSAHLLTEEGVYLTLGDTDLPCHPYSVLWKGFSPRPEPGWEIAVTAEGLFYEGKQLVSFGGFQQFKPPLRVRPMARMSSRERALSATRKAVAGLSPKGVFYLLLVGDGSAKARSAGCVKDGLLTQGLRRNARKPAMKLVGALSRCDWDTFCLAGAELAGMGEGLTPAGDDFLAGVLAALHFHGLSSGRDVLPPHVGERIVTYVNRRTTRFSAFLLRCAAAGQIARPLAEWLHAVHSGDAEGAAGWVPAIACLGHTSGLDALSGMVLALQNIPGKIPWANQWTL